MIKKLNKKRTYKTTDLALATAISLFYPMKTIDRQNPYKAQFTFKQCTKLDKLIEDYWRGELKVEPQTYFNALRVIKARLYADK